jgi:hypothetical protein
MSKKITSFYDDELNIKKVSLLFYLDEINKLEKSLNEIIMRNSIVDIAAKVEVHQLLLSKMTNKFNGCLTEIKQHKLDIRKDDELILDKEVTKEIENQMSLFSMNFKHLEQEYIDIKYYCNNFLEEMLKK